MLSRTFTVTTIDDGVAAGSRTVGLTLSAAVNASIGATNPAVLTIQDKESAGTFQFAAATGTVVEGLAGDPGRTLRVTVTRTGANLVGPGHDRLVDRPAGRRPSARISASVPPRAR